MPNINRFIAFNGIGLMNVCTVTIAEVKVKIQQIFDEGEVAPKGCYVARYQVRQRQKVYWYYKLQATNEIFEQTFISQKKE